MDELIRELQIGLLCGGIGLGLLVLFAAKATGRGHVNALDEGPPPAEHRAGRR